MLLLQHVEGYISGWLPHRRYPHSCRDHLHVRPIFVRSAIDDDKCFMRGHLADNTRVNHREHWPRVARRRARCCVCGIFDLECAQQLPKPSVAEMEDGRWEERY